VWGIWGILTVDHIAYVARKIRRGKAEEFTPRGPPMKPELRGTYKSGGFPHAAGRLSVVALVRTPR